MACRYGMSPPKRQSYAIYIYIYPRIQLQSIPISKIESYHPEVFISYLFIIFRLQTVFFRLQALSVPKKLVNLCVIADDCMHRPRSVINQTVASARASTATTNRSSCDRYEVVYAVCNECEDNKENDNYYRYHIVLLNHFEGLGCV
jgi:hypothetical protein